MTSKSISNFFSFILSETSIRPKFVSCFKKSFVKQEMRFLIYESEIITISIFLFVSSSFFYKRIKEKYFDFNWKSHLKIFSKKNIKEFIYCSINFLLQKNFIGRNKKAIIDFLGNNMVDFRNQYIFSLIKKNSKEYKFFKKVDYDKYFSLVNKAVLIHNLYKYHIPLDKNKVLELVNISFNWKKELFEIFGNKAEYIVFIFFINLNK